MQKLSPRLLLLLLQLRQGEESQPNEVVIQYILNLWVPFSQSNISRIDIDWKKLVPTCIGLSGGVSHTLPELISDSADQHRLSSLIPKQCSVSLDTDDHLIQI